ncbi:hypothetical protein [Martelella endophytica]|uniref:Uncharacterized protein n=1 Tax=Martelella endophytica TaxID=1486262 RepID=A0A0D5LT11_MAREN|nr:hypothetical protein [Martelella endophytica]AJY46498.1 hypothetical protein TM49_13730 [Martelella endophytica]
MNECIWKKILGAAGVAVFAALAVPAMFGGKQDLWGRFIYDYQTLISGIAAVIAAVLTIRQMQRSDRAALTHHLETIAIQTLPYARRVAALHLKVTPIFGNITESGIFSEVPPTLTQITSVEEIDALFSWLRRTDLALGKAISCLDDKAWEEAQEAIPALLWARRQTARSTAHKLRKWLPDTAKETVSIPPSDVLATTSALFMLGTPDCYEILKYDPEPWKGFSRDLVEINADLERLRGVYKNTHI